MGEVGSGETRLKIAHNIKVLQKQEQLNTEVKRSLFLKVSDGKPTIPEDDTQKQGKIQMEMAEIDNAEVELKLWGISWKHLDPDKLQTQAVAALQPVLIDVPDLGEPDL